MNLGWLALGLVLLSVGADWLVKGASEIALRAGVTPLVIGLTVVAFGTSAPELLVSLQANLKADTQADIAVGNVVGSNICNIALLLGLAALIRPLVVSSQVVKREIPILLGVTAAFIAMIWDGRLSMVEGAVLTTGIVVYVIASIRMARKQPGDLAVDLPEEVVEESRGPLWKSLMWVAIGLAGLVYGADRLVFGGVAIARTMGISEVVIGLTLVAVGTSLPELATTVAAARRNETDIIAGNIIGSNLFNVMAVMGISSVIKPIEVATLNRLDLMVMGGFTLALVPVLARGSRINRFEGTLLLVGYFIYCAWLVKPEWFGAMN
ncbi:cation:H+ antiporter [Haloferula luteola]|uniref:Cation:H+ antiporter n=1 Tax=Haloferula luteola TaxID=595692 RepID=A0A840UX70_9BACT|nr:calcium/sodium antiporter [Haloferula luteola]MBB5350747.1 cation:H+ antiporter [Haloferula luteola]